MRENGEKMGEKQSTNWYKTIILKQICIFLFVLITCTSIFLSIYYSFETETIGKTMQLMQERDKQVFAEIDNRLNELEFNIYELFESREINLLSSLWGYYDVKERSEKIVRIQDQLNWISAKDRFMSTIKLYLRNNKIFITPREYGIYPDEEEAELEQYMKEAQTAVLNNEKVYVYVRQLFTSANEKLPDYFTELQIQKRYFDNILDSLKKEDTEGVILVGDEILTSSVDSVDVMNELIHYCNGFNEEEKSFTFEYKIDSEKYFCSSVCLASYPITLLTIRTEDSVFGNMVTLFQIIPVVLVMDMVVIFLFCLYMNRFVKQKIELNKAQMKQLQAQINPHFLYNTLFMLRTRARKKDYEGVESLAGLMGEYFQFLNRDKKDFVTLESELRHAYVYAEIQANRFSERFMFEGCPCPEKYRSVSVPRLILQPLMENAIKYQVEKTEDKGILRMYLEERENKLLVILESSIKVDEETVRNLNRYVTEVKPSGEVTSTINIMRRLRLYYGKGYRLYYEASKYSGLKTIVELDYGRKVE